MAIPFMTGYYSKDQILLQVFYRNSYLFLLIYTAAIITAAYSIKLFISAFTSLPRLSKNTSVNLGETGRLGLPMLFGILLLSFGSVFLGYITSYYFDGGQSPNATSLAGIEFPFLICMALLGILSLALISGRHNIRVIRPFSILADIDLVYLRLLTNYFARISTYLFRNGEAGLEILMGGTGMTKFIGGIAFRMEVLT